MWNGAARDLAINAIITVESNKNWGAINNEAFAIGAWQWFGSRAAQVARKMITDGTRPSELSNATASLFITKSSTDPFWQTWILTQRQRAEIKALLLANIPIQQQQINADIEDYLRAAANVGFNRDTHTKQMTFWFVMWHLNPAEASKIASGIGVNATVADFKRACMLSPIFDDFKNRWDTAEKIIAEGSTGHGQGGTPGTGGDGPGHGIGGSPTRGDGRFAFLGGYDGAFIREVNGLLEITLNGKKTLAYPQGAQSWRAIGKVGYGVGGRPGGSTPPGGGGGSGIGGTPSGGIDKVLKWWEDRLGKFDYLQGNGRMDPDNSGVCDCSSCVYVSFKQIGITLGTWTGEQQYNGREIMRGNGRIDESRLKLGDLIFHSWGGSRIEHVEVYKGNGETYGMTGAGDGRGPTINSLQGFAQAASWWMVRRVI